MATSNGSGKKVPVGFGEHTDNVIVDLDAVPQRGDKIDITQGDGGNVNDYTGKKNHDRMIGKKIEVGDLKPYFEWANEEVPTFDYKIVGPAKKQQYPH
jgi:hypothetical protein